MFNEILFAFDSIIPVRNLPFIFFLKLVLYSLIVWLNPMLGVY